MKSLNISKWNISSCISTHTRTKWLLIFWGIYIYIYIPKYSPSSLRPWWLAATLRQVHNKSTTSWHVKMLWICCTAFDLLWICCRHFDLLWICCTTSCTTNPQQNRISGVWAYAVMRCLCVCLSVCLLRLWVVSKRINTSSFFSPSGSQAIVVFLYQTAW